MSCCSRSNGGRVRKVRDCIPGTTNPLDKQSRALRHICWHRKLHRVRYARHIGQRVSTPGSLDQTNFQLRNLEGNQPSTGTSCRDCNGAWQFCICLFLVFAISACVGIRSVCPSEGSRSQRRREQRHCHSCAMSGIDCLNSLLNFQY